jgi:hypothetical protein
MQEKDFKQYREIYPYLKCEGSENYFLPDYNSLNHELHERVKIF